ncbi:Lycopene epsilon cyclase- chloroplastic [Striga hermonthica]|uniref:Lycopene epsilon cyclase- chloroplastic n=1 Tax=Striga hermonthica TaxID=68872 RepID=A0A9N7RSJ1_STRHE|nr:Lycopene epsilon cyclase- chloroplastic [Striga hermonthica]
MESLGARNLAAMAVSGYPIVRRSRKKRLRGAAGLAAASSGVRASAALRVRCGGASAGSEGCLALPVREDFADEEDYVKAGGSELLFVQMQQNKDMDQQLATVASGAASGKLLEYEVGGPRVSVQTAYGVEVEVENSPYDPSLMVFMDYRDFMKHKVECLEAQYPTFLYAMPMSRTRVFFEETCLASKDAMPFELLKSKLMSRLENMGVRITRTYEEEWSYIPVGGSLPNTEQKNLAFGAAASMVHPATGYSVVRSLSEAPNYALVIANILKQSNVRNMVISSRISNISMQAWNALWPLERKRQRAFFLFGLALILQLDIDGIRTFFHSFFRLPKWMSQGFLGSTLSSVDLLLFALYMFVIAPNDMRKRLINHLLSDPTGAIMIKTYLTL